MDYEDAAVNDLLRLRRWHEWPRANQMGIDEFQDAAMPEIKALLRKAGVLCGDEQSALIAARLWTRLRE